MADVHSPGGSDAVSIHAPPEGRDVEKLKQADVFIEFQSTRPRRGAILHRHRCHHHCPCFNPRAPGGARSRRHYRIDSL